MDEYLRASNYLVNHALTYVSQNYDFNGLSPRAYHNSAHTQSVVDAVKLVANSASVDEHDRLLLLIAASFHDYIHLGDANPDNEHHSAEQAMIKMREYTIFDDSDISRVKAMILSTKCTSKYPMLVQSPSEYDVCAKILCDADLSSFGEPYNVFIKSADRYFEELYPNSSKNHEEYRKYLLAEIVILNNHRFWTTAATDLFPNTKSNARTLNNLLLEA